MAAGIPDGQRYVHVYLPSRGEKTRWDRLSREAGYKSLSKWVYHHVEHSLRRAKPDLNADLKLEFLKRIKELEAENRALQAQLERRGLYEGRLEEDLKRYRQVSVAAFLRGPRPRGVRRYDVRLVSLLQRRGEVRNDELLEELGVDPKDAETVNALRNQLLALQDWGLAEATVGGWRWADERGPG